MQPHQSVLWSERVFYLAKELSGAGDCRNGRPPLHPCPAVHTGVYFVLEFHFLMNNDMKVLFSSCNFVYAAERGVESSSSLESCVLPVLQNKCSFSLRCTWFPIRTVTVYKLTVRMVCDDRILSRRENCVNESQLGAALGRLLNTS